MREEDELIEKAESFLSDAQSAFESGMSLETVQNRLYYSMFLSAKAALLTEGVEVGTRQSVNRQVGRVLVKEKEVLERDMGRFYSEQQTLREQADYDPETSFEREQVKENLEKAREFVRLMKDVVES